MATLRRHSKYDAEEILLDEQLWADFPEVRGRSVFIKPNLVTPPTMFDEQSCTHSSVVEAVIRRAQAGGASSIVVGDCGFRGQWEETAKLSGLNGVCSRTGASLICVQEKDAPYTLKRFDDPSEYLSLYGVKVSDHFLSSDIVINLPKLKIHSLVGMTCAIKNLMGVITPKGAMHPGGSPAILHRRLRDLYFLLRGKVSWVLVDGIIGAEYAEQFGVPRRANVLISGVDMFDVDCASSSVLGFKWGEIEYLRLISKEVGVPSLPPVSDSPFERPLSWRLR